MTTPISNAIAAYQAATSPKLGGAESPAAEVASTGQTFGALLDKVGTDALQAQKTAEEMSKQAVAGKADLRDVVTAVQNAELTLETVVAVRDKVINAYNEILKMPI